MTQSIDDRRKVRIERLRAARRSDSADKRSRCLSAIDRLADSGIPITHTSVAVSAGVSRWFTYNCPDVRVAVERGATEQRTDGVEPPASPQQSASNASLRTDLAMLAAENRRLKENSEKLRTRLQLQLGKELTTTSQAELVFRLDGLIAANDRLSTDLEAATVRIAELSNENAELHSELEGKTIALRRLMHAKNA